MTNSQALPLQCIRIAVPPKILKLNASANVEE